MPAYFKTWVTERSDDMFKTEKFKALGKEDDYVFQALVFMGEASEKLSLARTILNQDRTLSNKDEIKNEFSEIQNKLEALKVRLRNNL